MVKRFCDTNLWQKEWFLKLSDLHRNLFLYIKDNCDCCGVYEANYMLLSFVFRREITIADILAINEYKNQIEQIAENKFFITDFCKFQYGELKETCKPHLKVIEMLRKHGIFDRVSKGYTKGIHTLEEKEKEEEEDKEKGKNISSSLVLSSSLEAEQHNPEKKEEDQRIYGKYNNVSMTAEQYNRLLGICASQKLLDELVDSLSENIETGKEQPFRSNLPNAHYVRIQKFRKYRLEHPEKFSKQVSTPIKSFKQQEWESYEQQLKAWSEKGGDE